MSSVELDIIELSTTPHGTFLARSQVLSNQKKAYEIYLRCLDKHWYMMEEHPMNGISCRGSYFGRNICSC
jgi:hypothetical protein